MIQTCCNIYRVSQNDHINSAQLDSSLGVHKNCPKKRSCAIHSLRERLQRISVLLYVVGWIWNTPAAGSDVGVRFYGRHVRQILHRWIFSYGAISRNWCIETYVNTNGLSCSSACCLYFGGPRDAATCDDSHSTACSSLPRHARRTL
ncbi:hypothetical protein AVEN_143577-1 [Araneus ventricosus]|uniref:Uncharacterized protein n=1 Tax=Araneus ventricosus TaxID=182803 RepID=A0A4Y2APR8_ARAVE|nr:hypothetical protein AVEN_143577-1 [Araneus ventricosus]